MNYLDEVSILDKGAEFLRQCFLESVSLNDKKKGVELIRSKALETPTLLLLGKLDQNMELSDLVFSDAEFRISENVRSFLSSRGIDFDAFENSVLAGLTKSYLAAGFYKRYYERENATKVFVDIVYLCPAEGRWLGVVDARINIITCIGAYPPSVASILKTNPALVEKVLGIEHINAANDFADFSEKQLS